MSILKKGQRCMVIKGCPKNLGLLVEIVRHIGAALDYRDGYEIITLSRRPFPELWGDQTRTWTVSGASAYALTERNKLQPLPDLSNETHSKQTAEEPEDELLATNR